MAKTERGWKTLTRRCGICEESFSIPYHVDPDFPDSKLASSEDAEIDRFCGKDCRRAAKLIEAMDRLTAVLAAGQPQQR